VAKGNSHKKHKKTQKKEEQEHKSREGKGITVFCNLFFLCLFVFFVAIFFFGYRGLPRG
jgi:hypothetical protein